LRGQNTLDSIERSAPDSNALPDLQKGMLFEVNFACKQRPNILNLALRNCGSRAIYTDESRYSMSLKNPQAFWGRLDDADKVITGEKRQFDLLRSVAPFVCPLNQGQKSLNPLLLQLLRNHLFVAGTGSNRVPRGLLWQ
jgi:hypothetical protein